MFTRAFSVLFPALLAILIMASCSGGKNPVAPENQVIPKITDTIGISSPEQDQTREILAVYDAEVNLDAGTFTVTPAERIADYHFPLSQLYPNVLKIVGYGFTPNFWADIKLTHPFQGSGIDAYDPRIIAIVPYTATNYFLFQNMYVAGNHKIVLEPDGFTKLHDSLGGSMSGNLNPFKAYFKNQPYRVWSSTGTTSETQRWNLDLAGFGGTIRYKLVVDVSTSYPEQSLPIWSNALEPVQINAVIGNGLTPEGGDTFIDVELLDWQGHTGIGDVVIECPSLFNGTKTLSFEEGTDTKFYYHGAFANEKNAAAGSYDLIVKTSDTSSGVEMYNLFKATVSGHSLLSNPQDVTTGAVELTARKMFIDGLFLYIAALDNGLHIYNIEDPRNPIWVKWIDTQYTIDVFVSNGLAYVACNDAIRIIDVSAPEDAHEIMVISLAAPTTGIEVRGGYAFVANHSAGLTIIDVDPVEGSHIVKQVPMPPGYAMDLTVFEGYAYVANNDSLKIVDVTPISSASIVKSIEMVALDVFYYRDYAYVASGYQGIQIVNISDPPAAFIEGNIDTPDIAESVRVYEDYAYVADWKVGMQIIKLYSPFEGEIINNIPSSDCRDVCLNIPYAYLGDCETGIRVIDITTPEDARVRNILYNLMDPVSIDVSGNYLYVTSEINGLQIIDNTPQYYWHVVKRVATAGYAGVVDVENGYACLSEHDTGLQIVDVDPYSSASVVKTLTTAEVNPGDLVVENGYAYVADNGLKIIDIDPPASASVVKSVPTASESTTVSYDNGYAYIGDSAGLRIIDVDPIDSAYVVKTLDLPCHIEDIHAEKGYVYIACTLDGMEIVDVYPPESAHLVISVDTLMSKFSIDKSGGYAYIGESGDGFQVVDVEPAETADVAYSYRNPSNCSNVKVFNNYAYASFYDVDPPWHRLMAFELW